MPLGLLALAIGGFGIGLTEFVIMGLLPEVAADFARHRGAGRLVHLRLRAQRVVVGALGLTAAATRLPRKPVLSGCWCSSSRQPASRRSPRPTS